MSKKKPSANRRPERLDGYGIGAYRKELADLKSKVLLYDDITQCANATEAEIFLSIAERTGKIRTLDEFWRTARLVSSNNAEEAENDD